MSEKPQTESCEVCRFGKSSGIPVLRSGQTESTESLWVCRRKAPTIDEDGFGQFPKVFSIGWCGEFEEHHKTLTAAQVAADEYIQTQQWLVKRYGTGNEQR